VGLKDKALGFINEIRDPKKLPGKVSFYLNNEKEKVRKNYRRFVILRKKMSLGKASLKEKLEFRSVKASLMLVPINSALFVVVPGGLAIAGGLNASKGHLSGNNKKNKELYKKLKEGEKLSYLERRRLRKANKS
jgi:hypothetical protein